MAEPTQEKPNVTGLKFAEQQLQRHGWEKGRGLGRRENGISEAIKVKIKCGKGGMGHKEGDQFTFHWWDHVFNKASNNLVVETGQDGVMVKADDSNNVLISNKKPTKAQQAKSMLYGSFVKSATLLSGEVQPEKPSDSDDSSSSSEDEDHKLDLSSTTKLSDADLLKACGGRTAHKGARHGLTMNAKLARLEQQELEFMNKYGKNNQPAQTSTNCEDNPDATEKIKHKKSKRKEKPSDVDSNGSVFVNDDTMIDAKTKKKKNRKDKAQPEGSFNEDCGLAGNIESTLTTEGLHEDLNEAASCLSVEKDNIPKKEKKKRMVASLDNMDVISKDFTDKQPHDDSKHQQTSDSVSKKKRKKKSSMEHHETSPSSDTRNSTSAMMITEDTNTQEQNMGMEGQEKSRKKNKKKLRKMEEQEVDEQVTFEDSVPKKKKKKSKE